MMLLLIEIPKDRNGSPVAFADGRAWIFSGNGGAARKSVLTWFDLAGNSKSYQDDRVFGRAYHAIFHWNRRHAVFS